MTFDRTTFNVLVHRLSRDQTIYQILEKKKNPRPNSPESFFMLGLARSHLLIYSSFLQVDHL